MPTVAMSGNDTVVVLGRPLTDFGDGNVVELTYPNEIAAVKTGKNGNSIYSLNESGNQADVKIRLIRGSGDDKFLNGVLAQQMNNFAGFPLMPASFTKKVGDGRGNITNDVYVCSGGIFVKRVEANSNVEGDSEQSLAIYELKFANSPRAIT